MFKRIAAAVLAALCVAGSAVAQDADQPRWFLSSHEDATALYRDTIHTLYWTLGSVAVSDPLDVAGCSEVAIRFNATDQDQIDDTPNMGATADVLSCASSAAADIDTCVRLTRLSYTEATFFVYNDEHDNGLIGPDDQYRTMEEYKPIALPHRYVRVDPLVGVATVNSDVQVRCRRNLGVSAITPFSVLQGWDFHTVDFNDAVDVAVAGHPWTQTLMGAASGTIFSQTNPRTVKPFLFQGAASLTGSTVDATGASFAYSAIEGLRSTNQWNGVPRREIIWATVGFGSNAMTGNTYFVGLIKEGNVFFNTDGTLDDDPGGGDGDPSAQSIGFHFATDGKIYAAYTDTEAVYPSVDTGFTFSPQEIFTLRLEKFIKRTVSGNLEIADNESTIEWYVNDRLVYRMHDRSFGSVFYQTEDMVPGVAAFKVSGTARVLFIGDFGYAIQQVPSSRETVF